MPRNEFNNVDLYQPWMLPHGTVHLTQPGLWQVARRLEVDFADAVIGFEFKKGRTFPIKEGIIVCVEFQSALLAVRHLLKDRNSFFNLLGMGRSRAAQGRTGAATPGKAGVFAMAASGKKHAGCQQSTGKVHPKQLLGARRPVCK